MKNDKQQRLMELALLSGLCKSPRLFVPMMDECLKFGMTDACFRSGDTRSAWIAVNVLFKANGVEWRAKRTSDDIALRMAIEETVDRKELDGGGLESVNLGTVADIAKLLVNGAEKFAFKKAIEDSARQVDDCFDVQTALMMTRQKLSQWERTASVRNNSINIGTVADELSVGYHAASAARANGEEVQPNGLQAPWKIMNECYNGFKEGLNFVCARPSEGKTALAINMSAFWKQRKVKHAFISLDMPKKESVKRYGTFETEITDKHLATGHGTAQQIEAHNAAIKSYEDFMFLYDCPQLSSIEMAIRESVHNGAQTIIIDYLQNIRVKGCKNKWESITKAVESLEDMSKRELKIPMIVLAQLNRQGVRDNREPELHDIEGGGFIEQAASIVTTINRDKGVCEVWKNNPPAHLCGGRDGLARWLRPVWVEILKNQNGAIGKFPFVMYCPFFALRPANFDATPDTGRDVCATTPFFDSINDDWRRFSFDKANESEGL